MRTGELPFSQLLPELLRLTFSPSTVIMAEKLPEEEEYVADLYMSSCYVLFSFCSICKKEQRKIELLK